MNNSYDDYWWGQRVADAEHARIATVNRRVCANWAHTGRSFTLDPGEYEVAQLVNDVAYLEPPDGGPQACIDANSPAVTINETEA